ncbi:hypothetical protein ACEWY4_016575 [Coilia grayii]|uniref:Ciliogenesis and planar polarity effector 1 n=1 Tax=Coilia grayii TaxID=363190 RepID=A0ABD1JKY7_9TELE
MSVTQVLFVSTQNFVSVSTGLGGCGSKNLSIPAKYVRSYWVANVCWSPGGLFLACVLKRGSLLMLMRLGELLTLSSTGCDIDFGPAHFLPLHPLVTYRPPAPLGADGNVSSSSASLRDVFRQRYSVTWHPRTPLLILSDGYNVTLLRALGMPTPTALVSSLLLDTAHWLEQARALLLQTQPQAHLESLSSLKFTSSLQALKDRVTPVPSLPLCVQDDGTMEDLQEAYEKAQADAEDDCPIDGQYSGVRREDGGSLEFASMFDTLHAQPDLLAGASRSSQGSLLPLHSGLDMAQRSLLGAWALMLALGGRVEQRPRLLRYAVCCASRLALLLHLGDGPAGKKKGKRSYGSWVTQVANLYQMLLSFLSWDGPRAGGGSGVHALVELSRSFTELLLSASPDFPLSSHRLAAASGLLQTAARSMDDAYAQRPRPLPQHSHPSDRYCTPLLQEQDGATDPGPAHACPQRPSARLGIVWQGLYKQALQYQAVLQSQTGVQSPSKEQQKVLATLCLIQGELQRAGVTLAEDPALRCPAGEELFLQGAYTQSVECWRAELWAEQERASTTGTSAPRSCYLQTRFGLALLYAHLHQYHLREAQALADHMAQRLLQEPGQGTEPPGETGTEECGCGSWPPVRVHPEAACAVVQSLGRFMAAYFANQPLAIRPAHCVDLLDPLHFPQAAGPRVVALSQQSVSAAVRSQQLSEQWTVGYALELMLIGGLLPEAVWLTSRLGDWTTAAALSLAYSNYCTENELLSRLRWKELHLPTELQPGSIFQAQLEALLGPVSSTAAQERDPHRHLSDPVEEADEEQLCLCMQELLKASVMARVDVLSRPIGQLLAVAKEMSSELQALVPTALYLPAPPLYCPQPSPTAQERSGDVGLHAERACRLRVSAVLRKALLLMRAARCALPAAQWYIRRLQRCHKNYRKIRKLPVLKEALLPEGLKRFLSQSGFFRREAAGDVYMDPIIVQILTCFRELCGLLWMLHIRDQLTVSCRKYQAARNHGRDSEMGSCGDWGLCEEAVRWACRLLPFSRFLCAEELLQDLLLSLLAQLPPTPMVAETLVRAFPEEEQSVRVALREKYTTLLHTLRPCPVVQPTTPHDGESDTNTEKQEMSSLLKTCRKQRTKYLCRTAKHMARVQPHLWEREEGGEERAEPPSAPDRLSLGASVSSLTETTAATLTSNTDGTTPQALSPDLQAGPRHSTLKPKAHGSSKEANKQKPSSRQHESDGSTAPVVGSWEFELEDEEYLRFLELFLSYLLERGGGGGRASEEAELPLIGCFWARLRERELHSLGFDVLTTLKRRQRDVRKGATRPSAHADQAPQLPVFRAGRCFFHSQQTRTASPERPPSSTSRPSSLPHIQPCPASSPGLWGSKHRMGVTLELSPSPNLASSKALAFSPSLELRQELDPQLEARFPTLGRLLEWMSRWADRRVLLRRMEEQRGGAGGGAARPVIRAKASAPAVLTALLLLERRYSAALLAAEKSHMRVPEVELTVTPVLQLPTCSGERKEQSDEEKDRERQQQQQARERERESSVDTGYPGSVGTPITLPDTDLQQPQGSEACELLDVQSESEGSNLGSVTSDPGSVEGAPQPPTQGSNMADAYSSEEEHSLVEEELDSPSARSPSPLSTGQSGQALTLADLVYADSPERLPVITHPEEDHLSKHRPVEANIKTVDIPIREAAVPAAPEQAEPLLPGPHPPVAPQGSSLPPGSTHPAMPSTNPAPGPAPDTANANPVTQLVQDELFRLVQLQQINFMSLMQVVGASFANLPFSQARLPVAQSTLLPQPNPPSALSGPLSHPTPFPSQPNIAQTPLLSQPQAGPSSRHTQPVLPLGPQLAAAPSHVHDSQAPTPQAQQTRGTESAALPTQQSSQGNHQQDMQPLTINSGPGRRTQADSIPASQGLLTTVGSSVTPTLPPGGSTQNIPSLIPPETIPSRPAGLLLLQLPPPPPALLQTPLPGPVREAWGPHLPDRHPPTQQQPASAHRWPERATALPGDLRLRSASGGPRLLPPPQHAAPAHGLTLLHLRPSPSLPVSLPLIPQPAPAPVSAPAPAPAPLLNPAGMGPFPRLQLLQRGLDPPSTGRSSGPPLRTPRLIPLEQLLTWGGGGSQGSQAAPPLLKASIPISTHDPRHSHPVCSTPSTHRQRRREEREKDKERTGKRLEVSFRPEDSIIPPAEPEMEAPSAGDGFVLPLGSCDSVLTGQRLLAASYATTAELHAYASTQKRPPELQDAGTNTEPDKCTSAQPSSPAHSTAPQPEREVADAAACLPPELFLDLRFPRGEGSPHTPDPVQGDKGRRFINVIDLEDGAMLQELPLRPAPTTTTTTTTAAAEPASSLTSAELHLLAASVTNATHTPPPQQQQPAKQQELDELFGYARAQKPENERPPLHTSCPAIPGPSEGLPSAHQESPPPALEECRGDALTRSLLEKPLWGHAQLGHSQASPSQVTVRHASARLSEMDRQLAALQSIADQMDRDFADTRLLVRTIDSLSPGFLNRAKEQTHSLPLEVTKAAKSLVRGASTRPTLGLTDVLEEDEETLSTSAAAAGRPGVKRGRSPLLSQPPSSRISAHQRHPSSTAIREQTMWDTSQDFTGTIGDQSGSRLAEDTLGLSGLSDVADILGDLVRDGGLSPSALGLSHTQAARLNRLGARGQQPQQPLQGQRLEQERRELRAWMRRKQRERLVEYRRQRDERRAQERKPFISTAQLKPNSRDVSINRRLKQEKDKVALLEHHAQRASEAYSLMSDLLTTPTPLPTVAPRPKSTSPASAKISIRSRSQSAGRISKSPGAARSLSSPGRTAIPPQRLMGTSLNVSRSSRLGLHRPASALPRDRLSQVTRRGMLTYSRGRSEASLKETQRRPLSQSPTGRKMERNGQPGEERGRKQRREVEDTEGRELLSPWDPPLEIRRILGLDIQDSEQQGARGTENDLDALENLSDSTGSILSKINWDEIEKMVADVEEDDHYM